MSHLLAKKSFQQKYQDTMDTSTSDDDVFDDAGVGDDIVIDNGGIWSANGRDEDTNITIMTISSQ